MAEACIELWDEHYMLTRETVLASVYHLPSAEAVVKRLYLNQTHLGNNLALATGDARLGRQYTRLLKEHIRIAIEIVGAALAGHDIKPLVAAWKANGTEIARFLSGVTGAPEADLDHHMQKHLTTTLREAVDAIHHRDALTSGQRALDHVREMAKVLAQLLFG